MGTNYYLVNDLGETHIGKSSGGWCFSLHVYPGLGIDDLPDWVEKFKKGVIKNEYGDEVSVRNMLNIITARSWGSRIAPCSRTCETGPNNLLRSRIDGVNCIGHGAGTWDLIVGEFS